MAKRTKRPVVAVLHGAGTHRLDGHWGRRKTFFDSELYRDLSAIIDAAIGHSVAQGPRPYVADIVCRVTLSPLQSAVLNAYADGSSLGQIAAERGIHKGTVQVHLTRARAKFASVSYG